jgi:hypothetical protein
MRGVERGGRACYTSRMRLLLALLLLAGPAAAQAPKRPAMHPHMRLSGRPAPNQLARNLINGSKNVRALHAHLEALDKEDPRQFKEWVGALKVLSQETTTLRWDLQQGRALIKNGVELDPAAVELSFEPGPPLDLPPQLDADGARVALALAAVEEAEPMAAAIILRAQGADELDRISAFEAAADEASLRVKEQRDQLARLAGEKAVDLRLSEAPRPAAAPAVVLPPIMGDAKPASRRDP